MMMDMVRIVMMVIMVMVMTRIVMIMLKMMTAMRAQLTLSNIFQITLRAPLSAMHLI